MDSPPRILALCRPDIDRQYAELLADQLRGQAEVVIDALPGGLTAQQLQLVNMRSHNRSSSVLNRLSAAVRSAVAARAVLLPLRVAVLTRRFRRVLQNVTATMLRSGADIIVLFEDNVGDATRLAAASAHRLNIPYVVLPTTIPNPREPERVYGVYRAHRVSGRIARYAARVWPEWAHQIDGRLVLRLPIAEIAALKYVGADSATPWILNSGQARAICVESEATHDIYRKLGVAAEQLVLTGSPVDDRLHHVYRDRARRRQDAMRRLDLDPERLLIVVAFPPDQYAAPSTQFEYPSFEALIDGWRDVLGRFASTANIVVRPHPRLLPGRLRSLEQAGCRVVTMPTEELVPIADVYVACISATIRWALALGIPVINYDCYRYCYDDFEGAPGLIAVENRTEFSDAMQGICPDTSRRDELRTRQLSDSGRWGCLDGKFSTRFLALIQRIKETPNPSLAQRNFGQADAG